MAQLEVPSHDIDLFIPWSGPSAPSVHDSVAARDRDNMELPYLLRSVGQNAPWVHHIWIAINGAQIEAATRLVSEILPQNLKDRVTVVDRCAFMPVGTCPTRNSAAVAAFAHRLVALSEHFIYVEDDIFLGRATTPAHFFVDGKPYVWRTSPTWGFFAGKEAHQLYEDQSVVNFSTPRSVSPSPHFWHPQLKSVCASLEFQYPEFYAFVGSHTGGRYSSRAKGISDQFNSQEEDFIGWAAWELLRADRTSFMGMGVYKNIDASRYDWWDEVEISKLGFQNAICDRAIFMNVNDRYSENSQIYEQQLKWFIETMDTLFPAD
jgi:hypothetical protein